MVQLSHLDMTIRKTIALTRWTFVSKIMSLLLSTLSKFVRFSSKEQVSFKFMAAVTICSDFRAQKIKSLTVSIVSPSICHEVMGPDARIFIFWMLNFQPAFSLSSFTFIKRLFSSSSLSAIRVVSSAYFSLQSWFQLVLHPAWHFLMYSACKLYKQGDIMQP